MRPAPARIGARRQAARRPRAHAVRRARARRQPRSRSGRSSSYDSEGTLGRALERAGINLRPAEFAAIGRLRRRGRDALFGLLFGGVFLAIVGRRARRRRRFCAVVSSVRSKRRKRVRGPAGRLAADDVRRSARRPQPAAGDRRARARGGVADPGRVPAGACSRPNSGTRCRRRCATSPSGSGAKTSSGSPRPSRSSATSVATSPSCSTTSPSTIRDRRRVSRQIKSLTAEGRLSAVILFCLPIVMFVLHGLREHARTSTTLTGVVRRASSCSIGSGALMVVGGLWLRRIVRVQY